MVAGRHKSASGSSPFIVIATVLALAKAAPGLLAILIAAVVLPKLMAGGGRR